MASTASGVFVHDASAREEGRVSGRPPTNERIMNSSSRGEARTNECSSNKPTSADSAGFEVRNVFQQRPDMTRVKQNGNLCRVRKNSVFRQDPISWNKSWSKRSDVKKSCCGLLSGLILRGRKS